MLHRLPSDLIIVLVRRELHVSDVLSLAQVSRLLHDVIYTRQVWHALAQDLQKFRPLALAPFESLQDLGLAKLVFVVSHTLKIDSELSKPVITPVVQRFLFSLPCPILFSQALPGGRYLLLALEKGELLWWDTQINVAIARHHTDNGLSLMRRVVLDPTRGEFVLGMVYANPETCESSAHLMRLSVLRLILPQAAEPARIVEYPSYPISFPITSIFVQHDFVGLVGIHQSDRKVGLFLLRRDTASVTCVNTGLQAAEAGSGGYFNAISSEKNVILYTEDASMATAHYYDASDLAFLSQRSGACDFIAHRELPPKFSRHFVFEDVGYPIMLHYFEASDMWRKSGVSCLSTLYTQPSGPAESPRKLIGHHYFNPESPQEGPLKRFFHELFSEGAASRVNGRGVELIVLGIYGRHVVWLEESEAGHVLKTTSFGPDDKPRYGVSTITLQRREGECVTSSIDSLELDDAFGVLYLTTGVGVYRVELS